MLLHEFSDRSTCENALLSDVVSQLELALNTKNSASVALAGGNTPKAFYQKLSAQTLNWQNVKVTLTDERWVDTEHADSNEGMLKKTLMQNQAAMCEIVPLKNSEQTPDIGQIRTADTLAKHIPELDFAILGMGDDGHFASIFPEMENTELLLDVNQTEPCLPAYPNGKPPRMSLTLAYLLKAKVLFVFITGEKKHQVLKAMQDKRVDNPLPIYYLIHQTICPLNVYWSAT